MKKLFYIVIVVFVFGCDSEDGFDCFQTTGNIIQQQFTATNFERITINRNVELILKEGPQFEVIIEAGENLIGDVDVVVIENQLTITDHNTCNLVRDYISTKAYVTAPNIIEIRNSSQFTVSSIGALTFPSITLISEDFNSFQEFTVGDFRLTFDNDFVEVISNNISSFYLTGQTINLEIGFFSGTGRFEGATFEAQHINVFHRGSNDMIVNPQQSLTGELRGTGNLISLSQPPLVNVEQFYTGELIFQD